MGSIERQRYEEEEEACLNAMLFCSSHIFPMVFRAAIELDLFAIIAKAGPGAYLSASEIACHLPTHNPEAPSMLDRMLRLFASHSLLSHSLRPLQDGRVERLYGLTAACKFFLPNSEEQGTLAPLSALSHHRIAVDVWLHMKDAILEGGSMFKKVHGMSIFEYMNQDPAFNKIFNEAMAGVSTIIMNAILDIYKGFEGVTSLVDVGGGNGRVLNMIISKYPFIKAVNFDLPHVVQTAPPYPGIQHVGGNMLTSVPQGDAIMIKDTCHNWSDENVIKVLKNIYQALPNKGKLIIMNAILPEAPETSKASQYVSRLDNTMLMQPAGKERTTKEFEALTMAAGFSNFHVACVARGIWAVMESFK
ncbi:hypothetical protein P3X46_021812 [Hevea brasiliensis]|uniref:O-methyltransferase domain-containing protein n=1 Tax=Hevea brasiliensis TaxID=3981 RepID=A0ABQ9LGT5_HEVBR|nr:caffeic acid 3-O-methyltransferase-like [Hevea brasiliensis]KAJ9167141.1 hypothetical protein P3X46_021812 [Hevea brasiliensis]